MDFEAILMVIIKALGVYIICPACRTDNVKREGSTLKRCYVIQFLAERPVNLIL